MDDTTTNGQGAWLGHRPELDGVRGLAVLAVAIFHAHVPFLRGGWIGVDVFFVLSGFLITVVLLEERRASGRIDLGSFYARRALRLLPALVLLLAALVALVLIGAARSSMIVDLPWVLGYATNWAYSGGRTFSPLVHLWSLAVEEQFYVVWPLALAGLLRLMRSPGSRATIVGGIAVVVTCARPILYLTGAVSADRAYFGSDLRADSLLFGCLLAIAYEAGWLARATGVLRRLRWPALAVLAVVACSGVSPFDATGLVLMTFVALAAAVVIAAAVVAPNDFAVLRWRPLARLGVVSYAFYLWHVPVLALLDVRPALRLVLGLPTAFAAAVVSQRAVERPAMRWRRRFDTTISPNDIEASPAVL